MFNNGNNSSLLRDDGGAGTVWWVLWMIIFFVFAGVAADSANAWRMRAELQATADAAAHAGVVDLDKDADAARSAATGMAHKNMALAVHGDVLVDADVVFGLWNGVTFTAVPDADVIKEIDGVETLYANAVLARTRRDATNSNRLRTYFLRLIGMDAWNVNAQAIAQRYFPECLSGNAIISGQIVDFQSNNIIHPGICIHAQDHVDVNGGGKPSENPAGSGNQWLPGVSVTMPSLNDFYSNNGPNPNSGNQEQWMNEKNEGLISALGEEWLYPKIVDTIPAKLASLTDTADPEGVWPSYIGVVPGTTTPLTKLVDGINVPLSKSELIITLPNAAAWNIATYKQGFIYKVNCKNPLNLNASAAVPLQNVVIVASCKINVGSGGVVKNAILGSTLHAGDDKKVDTATIDVGQGSTIGDSIDCSSPGGVKLISSAGVSGPGQTNYKGVQVLAKGKVHIAAQANAKVEINVQTAGDVDFASNNELGAVACPGSTGIWREWYYRLVL